VLRLPIGKGSESDPSRRNKGSPSASTFDSDPEREALIEEAIGLFSPRYGRAITREEARQLVERLTAFFGLLATWDRCKRNELGEK
jgi:hypothetical protein